MTTSFEDAFRNAILASKLARAVYYMLQTGTVFDAERVVATST